MKFLFGFNLFILLFARLACFAQDSSSIMTPDTSRSMYIGLDASKNIPTIFQNYFFQKSRIVEGMIMFPIGKSSDYSKDNKIYGTVHIGYSYIHADPIFKNLNYSNEGMHIKGGIDYIPFPYFGIGGNLIISTYQEYGKFTMRGPYYGNLDFPFPKRSLTAFGLELHYYLRIPLSNHFSIAPLARLIVHSPVGMNKNSVDSYYIPGMGITSRDIPVTVNASVALVYKLAMPSR